MRLNWFSPLPPANSGIADYTARILPTLRTWGEIIVWTDQDEWDRNLQNDAEVRCYHPEQIAWAEINRADMSVYHIGNNRLFHSTIWQVSRSHPGIVILHDLRLQNFFAGLYRDEWNDRSGYLAQMERLYGRVGRLDAESFWSGRLTIDYMVAHYPFTSLAVDNALGVLVHSVEGLDGLRQNHPCPVVYAPLPYLASLQAHEIQSSGANQRSGGPPYRIIVFGFINVNRRLDDLLQAIAELPERDCFRLDIYGRLWDDDYVYAQIQSHGLQELVTVHGFVPEAELEAALATSHLAVNLRYPTMGEASFSQLQIWAHALPTLVTRVGWYANLPEDAVAFVRPGHEIVDIQAHLRAFVADPDRFATMGEHGRRILEKQHAPQAYVQAMMDLTAAAQRFRSYATAYELAKRVGAEMRVWTSQAAPDPTLFLQNRGNGFRQEEGAVQEQLETLGSHQVFALQAIHEALQGQVEQWRHEQTITVEAIRRTVAEHAARLGDRPQAILQSVPKNPYSREEALRFPLSVSSHDIGFRYLFDFMVIAKSLNLRPGAEVLDFAAGSCYGTELLNRLGYVTVAFDLDPEFLTIGRERLTLDPRCDCERTRFVVGDGGCLPFPDESFDGIICMNALHHMPDYRATLVEMFRVLRSGGRAVFSEPGNEHSKHPESVHMMKEFGVLEKDVVLSEIYQIAKAAGFRRMILKPYVSPEHVELDYEEFTIFKQGRKVSAAYLTSPEIAEFMERFHPLFYLEKGGERPLTSATASPELLRARIRIRECPNRMRKGGKITVMAICENTGQSVWLSKPRPFGGYVTFGVKVLTPTGRLLDDGKGRQLLSEDVLPGSRIEVVSEVSLEDFEAGRYRLLFDMVNEQVHWFQHKGSEAVEQWLEIV